MGRASARVRALVAVTGLAVLVIAIVVRTRSGDGRPAALPAAYSITYRVTENGIRHWEVLSMHRPLLGSDLVYDTTAAPTRGDVATSGTVSTAAGLYTVDGGRVRLVGG